MNLQVGDIVQRTDINGKKRFVIYTRRVGGGGTPGIVTFPSQYMLKKAS